MGELAARTILVTGASKGIGAAIAAAVGEAGAHVIAHYGSDRAGAEAATAALPADRKKLITADFRAPGAVAPFWAEALDWRRRIDVVVNNAAIMRLEGGIEDSGEAWERVWAEATEVNLLAPARLMREAVRHFLTSGGGILITISSWVAQRGATNPAGIAYAATKAGITAATKTIARGYARQNVLAYAISPGVVRTRMSEEFAATHGGEVKVTEGLTMGEWVPPSDIAALAVFLASGRCRHLTGATLDVNGASYVR